MARPVKVKGTRRKGGHFAEITGATLSASPRRITDAYLGRHVKAKSTKKGK
jgi:hypothetical protein